jgi:hypothetical protein
MTDTRPPVTILTSCVGLGLYIPALLIERRLGRLGFAADVEAIEGYYTPARQRAHIAHRDAHHASFALAQLAHRMARSVEHCLDRAKVAALLERWRAERRRHFIVWAGFWLPVIEQYREAARDLDIEVDRCRIDAVVSASFKVHRDLDDGGSEIWLWNWNERRIVHELPVTDSPPVPFVERDDRLVVHGGGWGIGTYRDAASELAKTRYALDIVIHDAAERPAARNTDRALMLDPSWQPWGSGGGASRAFPPMVEVGERAAIALDAGREGHPMHGVIRAAKAIVSKPGGCTLIDSLAAATPVVLLEPYGYAEESNARLWEHLGFGISFASWRATGCDRGILGRMHENIVARTRGVDYPRAYARRLDGVRR